MPWWAVPSFTLAGVLITIGSNLLLDLIRRRAESAKRWDPDKKQHYLDFTDACWRLSDLPVWPADRTRPPEAVPPLLETVNRLGVAVDFSGPAPVTSAAAETVSSARRLAAVIDDLREGVARPADPTENGPAAYREARENLVTAIEAFIRAARHDLGITTTYRSGNPA